MTNNKQYYSKYSNNFTLSNKFSNSYKYNIFDENNYKKMLYSIVALANNKVIEIQFVPKNGIPININHLNIQTPINQQSSFSIFPLQINNGDKLIFQFDNDLSIPNSFACIANINGIIHRTFNNNYSSPDKIILKTTNGYNIVNPSINVPTLNLIDSINYISISPNNVSNHTLIWEF